MGEKLKQYVNYKKNYKTHKVKVTDSKGNVKTVRVTVDNDAPLCMNAKDILSDLFPHLPKLRD